MKPNIEPNFIGNSSAVEFLNNSIKNGNLSHAYLFAGPSAVGKKTFADIFAKSLLCETRSITSCNSCNSCKQFSKNVHTDFHSLGKDPEGKTIRVDAVRSFQSNFYKTSLNGNRKIGIIDDADLLNSEGANALLKTLEEPPGESTIILITENINSVPLTIISRCQVIPFTILSKSEIKKLLINLGSTIAESNTISSLAVGKPGVAIELFSNKNKLNNYIKSTKEIVDLYNKAVSQRFKYIQVLLKTKKFQERTNEILNLLNQLNLIVRDCILIKSDLEKNIVNVSELESLKKISSIYSYSELVGQLKMMQLIKGKLINNINPQIAIENYFLTMKSYA